MILVIDNYDSFVYNLVQYFGEFSQDIIIKRNDKITLAEIRKIMPQKIVISPGPGKPKDAGICKEIIKNFAAEIPILGVCLGHQCIAEVFGSKVVLAERVMHGKTSLIYHNQKEIFKDINNPFVATRYHSLIVEKNSLSDVLEIIAWTKQGEIMGLKHKKYPAWGVQFHPESILTKQGKKILKKFFETVH
ncbi:MAG: anthranilate/aminodeoxychorismate synthase component II [Candidatus Aenigmatarchaeota archaeon]|nr:MAG: anthranilate/aminodeoxychorismate synthase component II [Candidatus Aenigmarchaeota archaeon]